MKRIGIIIANNFELPSPFTQKKYILNRGTRIYPWGEGRKIFLTITGRGKSPASRETGRLVEKYLPDYVLVMGFSGGCEDNIKVGDLVVAQELRGEGERTIPLDENLIEEASRVLQQSQLVFHQGPLWTASRVVTSRKSLPPETIAVDMESFWVGKACQARDIPLLVVRSIIDLIPEARGFIPSFLQVPLTIMEIVKGLKKARRSLSKFSENYFSLG